MADFAAAAMMRLIRLGLARQGLAGPSPPALPAAHVALESKRALADHLLAEHGAVALLRIGSAVDDAPDEPVMIALALARDPFDVLRRWQRLERFIHSRHRIVIREQQASSLTLQHVALPPHEAPHAAEDLLVIGVLIAIMEYCGARNLRARIAGRRQWSYQNRDWQGRVAATDMSCWQLQWAGLRDRKAEAPDMAAADAIDQLRRAIEADPAHGWVLNDLAQRFGFSDRGLQRYLKQRNSSFSELLAMARLNVASRLLLTDDASLAEISFACGFADQAHFTRMFKRRIGTTPRSFKQQFMAAE